MSDVLELNGVIDTIHFGDPKHSKLDLTLSLDPETVKALVDWRGQALLFRIELRYPHGPLFGTREEQEQPESLGEYLIDGVPYPIQDDRREITGAELRAVAGLDPAASLWRKLVVSHDEGPLGNLGTVVLERTEEEFIEPTAVVALADGMRFVSGSVDQDDPAESPEEGDAALAQDLAADAVPVGANGRGGAE